MSVRRSLHSAYETSRLDASAHTETRSTQSGVYFGRFFCMNGACPRSTRSTVRSRSRRSGRIRGRAGGWGRHRVGGAGGVAEPLPLGHPGAGEDLLVETAQLDAMPDLV